MIHVLDLQWVLHIPFIYIFILPILILIFQLILASQTWFPIAYSRMLGDPATLVLVLFPTSDNSQVEIITSFSILEHELRMKEKARQGNVYGVSGQFIVMGRLFDRASFYFMSINRSCTTYYVVRTIAAIVFLVVHSRSFSIVVCP
jgi:hypothetical protein